MSEETQQQARPAHPTAGWICVAPFPRPEEDEQPKGPMVAFGGMVIDMSGRSPLEAQGGVRSGVLLENGPTAESIDRDVLMPYAAGATVFYGPSQVIDIGGFHYLPAQQVIAWEEAP